ncbi:hypothetical protein PINS_up000901 [Pythium insidiosum]|nr:hypothetical protein PINS_up000901 [Pythium insidiosum]
MELSPECDVVNDVKLEVIVASSRPRDDDDNNNNSVRDAEDTFPMEPLASDVAFKVEYSPIPKERPTAIAKTESLRTLEASKPVKSIVSRFEKKPEQSLDALPFRTVRSFFSDAEERSVHVSAEKQKYDALLAKQRMEAALRSPDRSANNGRRSRAASTSSAPDDDGNADIIKGNNVPEEPQNGEAEEALESEIKALTNQEDLEHIDTPSLPDANDKHQAHEDPPSLEANPEKQGDDSADPQTLEDPQRVQEQFGNDVQEQPVVAVESEIRRDEVDNTQLIETPEQEVKKRPILTTERSFVMEDDHTIETEDMVVVGERFSTEGEEDHLPPNTTELLEELESELCLTPEDERELTEALDSNPSPSLRKVRPASYKKPDVPSKLFAPTAASVASRTTKNPKVERKEKVIQSAKSTPKPATPRKNPYANVKSKVKEIIDAPSSTRKDSNASDASSCLHSPASSTRSGRGATPWRTGAASVDRRSFMSNRSSRSSNIRSLADIHGDDVHSDWEGRHRAERLSFASSTSSTDSTDPFALQLSFTRRKSRYDDVAPRYLEYAKSPVYSRNKEAQLERRKRLEEANSAKSVDRQQQLKSFFKEKEQRSKESAEDQVRRGQEMHKFRESVREKDRMDDLERRKAEKETRRALNGTESTSKQSQKSRSPSARYSLTSNPDAQPLDVVNSGSKDS